MLNIADLIDPTDDKKRTFREINLSRKHKFKIADLVQLETGVVLFVGNCTRDCDGSLLYTLTPDFKTNIYGYAEEYLKLVPTNAN